MGTVVNQGVTSTVPDEYTGITGRDSLKVKGTKVVGTQGLAVTDAPALTSANRVNSVAAPTKAEFDALVAEFNKLRTDLTATNTALNALLARSRAATGHGLIA